MIRQSIVRDPRDSTASGLNTEGAQHQGDWGSQFRGPIPGANSEGPNSEGPNSEGQGRLVRRAIGNRAIELRFCFLVGRRNRGRILD